MIIDTNGFEIGKLVWVYFKTNIKHGGISKPTPFMIRCFKYYPNKLILVNEYGIEWDSRMVYKSEQQCQLACYNLNGINND